MSFWSDIEVDGSAYVNLNELVIDHEDKVIRLFTDEELKEELNRREEGRSKYESRVNRLYDVYVSGLRCCVDTYEAMDEINNEDLLNEVRTRGLSTVDTEDISKYEIRGLICKGLGINEFGWSDEEIFEMLREIWKVSRYAIE